MHVVTLSRQIGSGGDDVARGVAQRLGLRLIGRDIVNQAARQASVPEVALAEIDELGLLGLKPGRTELQRYRATVIEVMRAWAAEGNVLLLGRGGQVALADWPGVVRVRVIAPFALRLGGLQRSCGVTPDIAAAQLEARDRARANYLQRYFGRDPNDAELYDLVLNMAHVSAGAAIEIVCQAVVNMHNHPIEVQA